MNLEELLPEKTPPPGGLARLRARLIEAEKPPRSYWGRRILATAFSLLATAALCWGIWLRPSRPTLPLETSANTLATGLLSNPGPDQATSLNGQYWVTVAENDHLVWYQAIKITPTPQ